MEMLDAFLGSKWAGPAFLIVGALLGALITATVQISSQRRQIASAHALKIAEMRRAWTAELRSAMATFQSHCAVRAEGAPMPREAYEAGTTIELLMNPRDADYPALQAALYAYLTAETREAKVAANAMYLAVCQAILKREWETLKGEIRGAG